MVELRKRKAPADTAPPPVKKANSVKSFPSSKKGESSTNGSVATSNKVAAGDTITIDGFGGEVEVRTFRSNLFCPLVSKAYCGSKEIVLLLRSVSHLSLWFEEAKLTPNSA